MSTTLPLKHKQFTLKVIHSKPNALGEHHSFSRQYTYAEYGQILCPNGLLYVCLDAAEKRSRTVPILSSDEQGFRTCLHSLIQRGQTNADDEDFSIIVSLCCKSVIAINEAEIRQLFHSVETVLIQDNSLTDQQRFTASCRFRAWMSSYVVKYSSGFHLRAVRYKSLIAEPPHSSRNLIVPLHTKDIPAIEEIAHDNVAQLEKAVLQRVQAAINEIKTVCISILDTYDKHKAQVETLLELRVAEGVKEFDHLQGTSAKSRYGIIIYKRKIAKRFGPQAILAWKAQEVQRRLSEAKSGVEWPNYFFTGLNPMLPDYYSDYAFNAGAHYLLSPWFLPSDVRVACAVILMIKTNWNKQTVRDLDLLKAVTEKAKQNGCSLEEALACGLTVQGHKGKTDDESPEYTIEPGDELEMRVLTYLWGHVKNLRNVGEPITSIFVGLGEGVEGVFGTRVLPRWHKNHGAPEFTWEQLRIQSAADFHLKNRDLDALRERLGHTDSKTTQGYLEQILLTRINSAINLEFQQRFETSVIFVEVGHNGLLAHGLDKRYIDPNLFIPLGDGTACSDINHPQDALPGETICGARTCHVGDGCPRNKIVMNVEQAELMLRTQRYYLSHFDELKADNSYFEAYTLPAMMFNFALVEFVKNTRPDMFAEANLAIQNTPG